MPSYRFCSSAASAASLLLVPASARAAGPDPVFTDITDTAGVAFTDTLIESLAWGDFDNDGDQDLYLTGNGKNRLMRNEGAGAFTDITDIAGVGSELFSVGAAFGDLDNDGDLDLYVVNFQLGPDVLYRNDGPVGPNGEWQFTDVAEAAGIINQDSSRGMGFFDYDRDGLLDIYVNAIGPDIVYHNRGALQFELVAARIGMATPGTAGQGVGACPTDINDDGWIDLFTGNRSSDINSLFLNDGAGAFADIAVPAGIDKVGLGMGIHSFDYDNDLDMDLYWTAWPGSEPVSNALYENIDGTTFTDVAAASGTLDTTGWGISNNAGDVNNDGWEDFFVTNGFDPSSTPNVLFVNKGDKTFADRTSTLESGAAFDGRGAAFADLDGDGDLDLCVTADAGEPTRLWRNDTLTANHWVTFDLEGTCSNRSAIGARIQVTTDVRTTVKEVSGGAGRGSFNSLPVEFGLENATAIQSVKIRWPNGLEQTIDGAPMDQVVEITEPVLADINQDGALNILDFPAFQAAFVAGAPEADVNSDGNLDVLDFTAYQTLFQAGGCP